MSNGDWGLGIGDWGLGIGPNPQSPIPIKLLYNFNYREIYFFTNYTFNYILRHI